MTRYKEWKRPPEKVPDRRDVISKADAMSFIAWHTLPSVVERSTGEWQPLPEKPPPGWRNHRKNVSKRIDRAIEKGDLCFDDKDEIKFGFLMAWARGKKNWADNLKRFPRDFAIHIQEAVSFDSKSFGIRLPGSLEDSHSLISRLEEAMRELAKRVAVQEEKQRELEPKTDKQNGENGKQGFDFVSRLKPGK